MTISNDLELRAGKLGWWIRDAIARNYWGPYEVKAEANSDRLGLVRFYREDKRNQKTTPGV